LSEKVINLLAGEDCADFTHPAFYRPGDDAKDIDVHTKCIFQDDYEWYEDAGAYTLHQKYYCYVNSWKKPDRDTGNLIRKNLVTEPMDYTITVVEE